MKLKFFSFLLIWVISAGVIYASIAVAQTLDVVDQISAPVVDTNDITGASLKKISNDSIEKQLATSTFSSLIEKESAARDIAQNKEITDRLDKIILLLQRLDKKR